MRDITCFSANFLAQFENDYNNVLKFNGLMMDAAHSVYSQYSKEETDVIIRNQCDRILGINFKQIPGMFGLIFRCAFNMDSLYGAIWGSTIMWGVKRGIYSNEA